MDFIINQLNNAINVSQNDDASMLSLLRQRIEYILCLLLGCLWNENKNNMVDPEDVKKTEIVEKLHRMTIGEIVGAIRTLDKEHKYVSGDELNILDKYPVYRNKTFGHGFVNMDQVSVVEKELEEMYADFSKIKFISKKFDIVLVTGIEDNRYTGIRFDLNNTPNNWACPKESFRETLGDNLPSVFLLDENRHYYRISPFVFIGDILGRSAYIFQSLEDKLSGRVKMSPLIVGVNEDIFFKELISMSYESERRRMSSNGTIMNYFDTNYSIFIDTPIENKINHFLSPKSRANVQATIWGHGGVGKTACIQNVCMKKYNGQYKDFDYIIFTSAKERKYDPFTGEIVEIDNLRSYEEVINTIIAVIFDEETEEELQDKENKIIEISSSRVLLVIDDYETFPDEEKKKIQNFIGNLDVNNFKVIITTRNKRLSTGVAIPSAEFDLEETKNFLLRIFDNEYPKQKKDISSILEDPIKMASIQQATSGRAIFIYQFAYIFVQKGFHDNDLKELKDSKNAQEFLYGKIFSFLSDCAKKAFICISQITEEENLIFQERIIEYLLINDFNSEEISESLQELIDQKIIEPYGEHNYRIYTKELLSLMQEKYNEEDNSFTDKIRNKLQALGGTNFTESPYERILQNADQGGLTRKVELYEKLLKEKECERHIKKKALIHWVSYVDVDENNTEGAIQIFEQYLKICDFQNDVDLVKLYAQKLWSLDTEKERACDVLKRYFNDKTHKKTAEENLELFSIAVLYCSLYALENERMPISAETKIFNEYGCVLYNYVLDKDFNEFSLSVKHNIPRAFIQVARLALDLIKKGYAKDDIIQGIFKFGNANFDGSPLEDLKKIQREYVNMKKDMEYEVGVIVEAKVYCIMNDYVLVRNENIKKAVIFNNKIPPKTRENLQKGDIVTAKVLEKNEQGYRLSMKI